MAHGGRSGQAGSLGVSTGESFWLCEGQILANFLFLCGAGLLHLVG